MQFWLLIFALLPIKSCLAAVCDNSWVSKGYVISHSRYYKAYSDNARMQEAIDQCQNDGATLAMAYNFRDYTSVMQMLGKPLF